MHPIPQGKADNVTQKEKGTCTAPSDPNGAEAFSLLLGSGLLASRRAPTSQKGLVNCLLNEQMDEHELTKGKTYSCPMEYFSKIPFIEA